MLYTTIISIYVLSLSLYVVFEAISVAADVQMLPTVEKENTTRHIIVERFNQILAKVKGGHFCISAKYLMAAIAALYLFRESVDSLFCLYSSYYPWKSNYCAAVGYYVDNQHAVYATAIFLSCWPRMVHRVFGETKQDILKEAKKELVPS